MPGPVQTTFNPTRRNYGCLSCQDRETLTGGFSDHHPSSELINLWHTSMQWHHSQANNTMNFDTPTTSWISIVVWWGISRSNVV